MPEGEVRCENCVGITRALCDETFRFNSGMARIIGDFDFRVQNLSRNLGGLGCKLSQSEVQEKLTRTMAGK